MANANGDREEELLRLYAACARDLESETFRANMNERVCRVLASKIVELLRGEAGPDRPARVPDGNRPKSVDCIVYLEDGTRRRWVVP